MLKRLFVMLIMLTLIFSVVGCSKEQPDTQVNQEVEETKEAFKVEFETLTIYGEEVNSDIFSENKLTMINVWATFCSPCIDEIPDIQELFNELKKENIDVNIIGIVADITDEENEKIAIEIIKDNNVEYINIVPDLKIIKGLLKEITAVPTTLFVDENGNVVGEAIVGPRTKKAYKKEILNRLDTIK